MRKPVLFFIFTTLVIASMACSGTLRGIDRYSGKRIYFVYEEEKFGSAELQVKMPDGELFIGKNIEESMAATLMNFKETQKLFCLETAEII